MAIGPDQKRTAVGQTHPFEAVTLHVVVPALCHTMNVRAQLMAVRDPAGIMTAQQGHVHEVNQIQCRATVGQRVVGESGARHGPGPKIADGQSVILLQCIGISNHGALNRSLQHLLHSLIACFSDSYAQWAK